MKVAILQCVHEANSFSVTPVTIDDFRACQYLYGEQARVAAKDDSAMAGALSHFDAAGVDVQIGLCTVCPPGGPLEAASWLMLRLALLHSLQDIVNNGRADILVIFLHGALAAWDAEQPEADLLQAARRIVGADCILACAVDFHANLCPELVANADLIVGGQNDRQTDGQGRGRHLATLALASMRQRMKTRHFLLPLIAPLHNGSTLDAAPFAVLADSAGALQQRLGLDDLTVLGGFPYADHPWVGVSILVTGGDPATVRLAVTELAAQVWAMREPLLLPTPAAMSARSDGAPADPCQLPYTRLTDRRLPVTEFNEGDWRFHVKMLCLGVH